MLVGLGLLAALYGGLAGWLARRRLGRPAPLPAAPAPALDAVPRDALAAAAERILPGLAGAAGVAAFIEREFARDWWGPRREALLEGLAVLDRVAQAGWQRPFARLPAEAADEVLTHVQTGGADSERFSGEALLHDLVVLCLEGLLGDPRHGGNRNQLGWRFIGFIPGCPRHPR